MADDSRRGRRRSAPALRWIALGLIVVHALPRVLFRAVRALIASVGSPRPGTAPRPGGVDPTLATAAGAPGRSSARGRRPDRRLLAGGALVILVAAAAVVSLGVPGGTLLHGEFPSFAAHLAARGKPGRSALEGAKAGPPGGDFWSWSILLLAQFHPTQDGRTVRQAPAPVAPRRVHLISSRRDRCTRCVAVSISHPERSRRAGVVAGAAEGAGIGLILR